MSRCTTWLYHKKISLGKFLCPHILNWEFNVISRKPIRRVVKTSWINNQEASESAKSLEQTLNSGSVYLLIISPCSQCEHREIQEKLEIYIYFLTTRNVHWVSEAQTVFLKRSQTLSFFESIPRSRQRGRFYNIPGNINLNICISAFWILMAYLWLVTCSVEGIFIPY